jgi:hypothetical protein
VESAAALKYQAINWELLQIGGWESLVEKRGILESSRAEIEDSREVWLL